MTRPAPGIHDFDFLFGAWNVLNRRLPRRLEGCTDWQEFHACAVIRPVLGGVGNVDEIFRMDGTPLGFTFRSFDLRTGQWHIHWVSPRDGVIQPPMIGSFQNGLGLFFGEEQWEGKTYPCRFTWEATDPDRPRWTQALSPDGGQTWETNWTMTLSRGLT